MSEYKDKGRLCMGCMNPLPEGRHECGICGYPTNGNNEPLFLPVGTVLSERYLVGKLLEQTGDAAVYIGFDNVLKSPITIREFFPDTLAERMPNGSLRIIGGCETPFRDYYEKFRIHARALARMRELTVIVAVYDIFEQNQTAYTVSEYSEGITLEVRLKQLGGRMKWDEARPLFMPLLSALISLHTAGVTHLGISPQNLVIGSDGKLRLQGFCITDARRVSTDLRPRLTSGYSAPEQYGFGRDVGVWSDVYGLAATVFRTLTGNPPPEAPRRAKDSNDLFVPSDIAAELPDYIAAALFNGLQVDPENRTRTIDSFRDQLSTAPAVSRLRQDEVPENSETDEEDAPPPDKKNSRTKYAVLIVLAVFIFLLLAAGTVILILLPDLTSGNNDKSQASGSTIITIPTTAPTTQRINQPEKFATPDLVGKNYYDIREDTLIGKMKIAVEYMQYSNRPKGEILNQTPSAETGAVEGATIKVVISAGPEKITVPDVSGWHSDQAKLYLEALGFRVTIMPVVSDTVDKDMVESVQEAGNQLEVGSKVTLRVSETTLTTTAAPTTQPTEYEFQWPF
ncbi:MAG: PASTA domain-containing protein [Oscillospiraceae bacterium]|nr:PASTA domain-containing protein [Oscillospiraceae bacterium]MDD4413305.1 PASTA domain-containing protein [Oscillospiraceae bacterium]